MIYRYGRHINKKLSYLFESRLALPGHPALQRIRPPACHSTSRHGSSMEESSMIRKSGIAPAAFLEKLYDIMENVSLAPYICWQPDGLSFLIRDVQAVSEFVLPYYFKHNNIQSFVRQLNMYNFTKTRHDSNYREFRQPMFQRGRRYLLSMIKRKSQVSSDKSGTAKRKYNSYETDNDARYTVTNNDEVSVETGKDWDGDDEGVGDEATTSSNCSSDNDVSDSHLGRYDWKCNVLFLHLPHYKHGSFSPF